MRAIHLLPAYVALCALATAQQTPAELLAAAKAKLAPDRRTVVFDVAAEVEGNRLTLRGEVHDVALRDALLAFVRQEAGMEVVDALLALPEPGLGEMTFGVVDVSVANLRTAPANGAELGTQALLGTPLSILKQKGGWLYVQMPNRYLGWVDGGVQRMTPEAQKTWRAGLKLIVTATGAEVRDTATAGGVPIADVVAGCILGLDGSDGDHYAVRFPDGRSGWLDRTVGEPLRDWLQRGDADGARLVATARRFLGVPYLWGGTSTKMMDCSGFTSTVYFLNGLLLPRDASQQVLVGQEVEPGKDFAQLQPGDLLFFGSRAEGGKPERVRHVAISLGGARFVHESVMVRYNSLDPKDSDYSDALRQGLLHARRMLGSVPKLADLACYQER